MTPGQIKLLHVATRKLRLTDQQYRMILKNVADVGSSKDKGFDNSRFEDVMAVLEDMGFRDSSGGGEYWRNKVRLRGTLCGERMIFKIRALIPGQPYPIEALCYRFSNHRTNQVHKLEPREAHALIEMLKDVHERTTTVTEDTAHAPAKVARIYEIPALAPSFALDEAGREDVPF